jgi:hypothetical protein
VTGAGKCAGGSDRLFSTVPLKVTHDKVGNAAYIYFQPPGTRAAKTYPSDPIDADGMINLVA